MTHALIFAGGTGKRIKTSDIPKQFIEIEEKPIIIHTIEFFDKNNQINDITIVCIEEWIQHLKEEISKYKIKKVKSIIPGGKTGFESIHKGLIYISRKYSNDDVVLICDGVRPVLDDNIIENCIKTTKEKGNAVPVVRAIDSVMVSCNGTTSQKNISRDNVYITQAPQGYFIKDIISAHNEAISKKMQNPISSADLFVELGRKIFLFEGNRNNIKVTTEEDLEYIKYFLKKHNF